MRAVELETNIKVRQNILDDGIVIIICQKKSQAESSEVFFCLPYFPKPKDFQLSVS